MLSFRYTFPVLFFFSLINPGYFAAAQKQITTLSIRDLHVRDPFIFPHKTTGEYFLYKSAEVTASDGKIANGVVAYKSKDLETWTGPFPVFTVPAANWASGRIWAPEVHLYKGRYYLFATINSDVEWKKKEEGWPNYFFRGTQVFYSQSPLGPFLPFGKIPHTPQDQMALDGTLWEENGQPYMIYCHEWVQTADGTIAIVRLKSDLSAPAEAPLRLFNASAAGWSTGTKHASGKISYVTDGCFLYRSKSGKLLMIWSSFKNGRYAIGVARSYSGSVLGPWIQEPEPLFDQHGGHGMLFKTFDGKLMLTFHGPNSPGGAERAQILEIEDAGETLKLKAKAQ